MNDPPTPLTTVHCPEPTAGVLPARVSEELHIVISSPAFAGVGGATSVIVTSSVDTGQSAPLVIVHRSVYVNPGVPVKDAFGAEVLSKVPPVPLTTDQVPVPDEGVFAARATVDAHTS